MIDARGWRPKGLLGRSIERESLPKLDQLPFEHQKYRRT